MSSVAEAAEPRGERAEAADLTDARLDAWRTTLREAKTRTPTVYRQAIQKWREAERARQREDAKSGALRLDARLRTKKTIYPSVKVLG